MLRERESVVCSPGQLSRLELLSDEPNNIMLKLMGEIRGQWAGNHTSATSGITTIVWKIISAWHNGLLGAILVKTKL